MTCRQLTSLTLHHAGLIGDNLANVIKQFCLSIRKLDLSVISKIPARQIRFCENLIELHLMGKEIPENTLNSIVSSCQQLIIVEFYACNITDTTMKILLEDTFKKTKRSLHTLLLPSSIKLTDMTMNWICNHADLRILRLCKCPWVTTNSLLKVARFCKRLQILDIKQSLIQSSEADTEEGKKIY